MVGMDNWSLAVINVTKTVLVEPVHETVEKVEGGIGAELTSDGLVGDKITYFVAPSRYLDNKLTSYGGALNYSIFYTTGLFGKKYLLKLKLYFSCIVVEPKKSNLR